MPDHHRRKLLDSFQCKLIVRIVSYWFIYQLTLWNLLFCWRLFQVGEGGFFRQFHVFLRDSAPMLICFAVLVPAFVWDAVSFYRRIARPLGQLRQTTRGITAGQPVQPVRLRPGDELNGLQDDFNAMLDALAARGALTLVKGGDAAQDPVSAADDSMLCAGTFEEQTSHVAG